MYQIPLLKTKTAIYSILKCSVRYFSAVTNYQRVHAATVKFRKFGIVPVSSLTLDLYGISL